NLFGLLNKETPLTNEQKIQNAVHYADMTKTYYELYWKNRHDTLLGFKALYTAKLDNLYRSYLDLTEFVRVGSVHATELATIGLQLQLMMGNDERTQPKVLALHKRGLIKPDTALMFAAPEVIWFNPKRFAGFFDFNIFKQNTPYPQLFQEPYRYKGHPLDDIFLQTMRQPLPDHLKLHDQIVELCRENTYRTIIHYMYRFNSTVSIGDDWIEAFIACSKALNKIEAKLHQLVLDLKLDLRDGYAEALVGAYAKYTSKALSKTLEELEKFFINPSSSRPNHYLEAKPYLSYFGSTCEFLSVGARGYKEKNKEVSQYPTFPRFESPVRRGYAIPYELDKPTDKSDLMAVTNQPPNEQSSIFSVPMYFIVTGQYKDFFKIAYCYEQDGKLTPRPIERIYIDIRGLLPLFLKANPQVALREFGREVQADEIGVQLIDGTINVVLWGYGNVDWIKIRS
ncbi:TPA: hypothetical protein OV554_003570, partial [Acinetobacter baumannii]|nr:hypothetical protein [Acinetobacter baumannii]